MEKVLCLLYIQLYYSNSSSWNFLYKKKIYLAFSDGMLHSVELFFFLSVFVLLLKDWMRMNSRLFQNEKATGSNLYLLGWLLFLSLNEMHLTSMYTNLMLNWTCELIKKKDFFFEIVCVEEYKRLFWIGVVWGKLKISQKKQL